MTKRYLPIEQVYGIVLRAIPSGDSDLIVHIVSPENGRLTAVAPRMRKANQRSGVRLDGFDLGTFELKRGRSNLPTIGLFIPQSSWPEIRENLDRITATSCICESILMLLPEGSISDDGLFEITIDSIQKLCKTSEIREILAILLQSLEKILTSTGYMQEFSSKGGAKRLAYLLSAIEEVGESRLVTKSAVEQIINRFYREQQNPEH